jgi:hypothetical protein
MLTSRNEFGQFYELKDPLASRPLRLSVPDEWVTKDIAVAIGWGKRLPATPIRFRGYLGSKPTDILWGSLTPLLCIHQRVIDLLHTNNITGWSTYPVEVVDRKGIPLSNYFGWAIPKSVGDRDTSRSEIVSKPPPAPKGISYQVYRGLYFDLGKWDGSDLFRIRGFIITTEKVVKTFKRAKITNVRFTPVSEVEIDVTLDRFQQPDESD